jgi:hypothetical protein
MTDVRTNGAHLPEKIPGDNAPANAEGDNDSGVDESTQGNVSIGS